MGLVGSSWSENNPVVACAVSRLLNAKSARHGARPGPTLARWCTGGPPACSAAESARKKTAVGRENSCIPEKKDNFIQS